MTTLTAFLQTLDPKLVYACIAGIAGGLVYLWRKISIDSWNAVTRHNEILQTLPAIILSGLMSAAPAIGKDLWTVVANIVFGAVFSGGASIVGHQVLKASPLPYQGGTPPAKPPMFPSSERKTPPSMPTITLLLFVAGIAFAAIATACYHGNPPCNPSTVDWPGCDSTQPPRASAPLHCELGVEI